MYKFKLLGTLLTIVMLVMISQSAMASSSIKVEVNGKVLNLEGREPVLDNDRVYSPARSICEYIGAAVNWLPEKNTVLMYRNGIYIYMAIDSLDYELVFKSDYSKRNIKQMDVAPKIINGHTMVPIKYIIEAFGGTVTWNGSSSTVVIKIDPEKRGNMHGNHAVGSFLAFADNTSVFYADNRESMLFRMNPDGSGKYRISDYQGVANINSINKWVYYTFDDGWGIAKTKTDGEATTELLKLKGDANIEKLQVVEDMIYYSLSDGSGLYRLPIEGGVPQKVTDNKLAELSPFFVTYERIYFTDANREGMRVSAIDGVRQKMIGFDFAEYINVVDGWIYYIYNSNSNMGLEGGIITRVRIGGEDRQELRELPRGYALNVVDDWLYFFSDNGKTLCKAKVDGTEYTELLEDSELVNCRFTTDYAINGEWLYFSVLNLQNQKFELFRMKLSGQGLAGVEKLSDE